MLQFVLSLCKSGLLFFNSPWDWQIQIRKQKGTEFWLIVVVKCCHPCGENLLKDQSSFHFILIILIIVSFEYVLIILGENWCWSLSGLKSSIFKVLSNSSAAVINNSSIIFSPPSNQLKAVYLLKLRSNLIVF